MLAKARAKRLRDQGYFQPTIYLETEAHDKLKRHQKVEVFGEFTEDAPWSRRVACAYDEKLRCFKVDI